MNNNSRSQFLSHPQSTEVVIGRLLEEATGAKSLNLRRNDRHPFFRPVRVTIDSLPKVELSAFIRDISPTGIGLIHQENLQGQEFVLTMETFGGFLVSIQAKIVWTKQYGNDWYLSGMRAVDLSATQVLTSLVGVLASEFKNRWQQRYPYIYPSTIIPRGQGRTISALTRDISFSGIGLVHQLSLDTKYADLRIESEACNEFPIPIKQVWSKTYDSSVFLSGWEFAFLDVSELPPYRP